MELTMNNDESGPGVFASSSKAIVTRRALISGAGLAAAGFLLAACTPSGATAGGTKAAVTNGPLTAFFGPGGKNLGSGINWVHGLNLALTGTGAAIGVAMLNGATIAADLMNKSGGPNITLKTNDHQGGLVPPSISGVRRLVSQNHITSLGTSYGAASTALFPYIKSTGLTTFWSGGAGPAGLKQDDVWMTMALFALDATTGALAFLSKEFPNAKNLALIGQQENGVDAIKALAPQVWPKVSSGGKIVASEFADIGTKDFSALVARLKSVKAEVIFSTVYGDDMGYLIKQLREANITAPIMSIDLATPTVPNIAGAALGQDCYLAVDGYLVDNPNPYNKVFVDAYKAKYSVEPDYFAANFFEATNVLAALIGAAVKAGKKPGTGDVLSNMILANPTYPSVYGGSASEVGTMTFQSDHSVTKPIGVFKIAADGTLTKLATITKGSTDVKPV
jgi:ABC-type branched-subunit amino acid transport system substrate-binding protein